MPLTPSMGAVELVEASNGAIANKRLLYGVETAARTKPTIEQPAEGIYVFGGHTLAPIAIIETDSVLRFDFPDDTSAGLLVRRAVALFAPAIASPLQAQPIADLVLTNDEVYTVDAARSWTLALAVTGARTSYVGEDVVANSFVGPATRVVDLNGRMLLPGFQDSHGHPGMVADPANSVNLDGIMRSEGVLERIRRFARAHPDAAWIEGGGWDEGAFLAAALDEMKRLGIAALEELKHSI